MVKKDSLFRLISLVLAFVLLAASSPAGLVAAQDEPDGPIILDPQLDIRTVVSGLVTPTTMAFLDGGQFFVLEKITGQVKLVSGGNVTSTVLDLGVNFASERGLLGIALDPDFENNGFVYLYWTCKAPPAEGEGFFPSQIECPDEPEFGEDTDDVLAVPLLGNRVDRFIWDGASLTWDLNLVKLLTFQNDSAPIPRGQGDEEQPPRGNHDGGVITFGQDGKLYIIIGDVGRRGFLQNLPFGPIQYNTDTTGPDAQNRLPADLSEVTPEQLGLTGELNQVTPGLGSFGRRIPHPDDQFGGPFPDDAHFTGVILRLNTDGSVPEDNPFFDVGADIGGEIGENIQMTFAYGIRNSFGMDVDPISGHLWITENGEDAFDEINLVLPGFNSGWIQIMGPVQRIDEYKLIETTEAFNEDFPNLQQLRWGPENIADSPGEALRRLSWLPGSRYSDPEFSWKYATAPAAIGFVRNQSLGEEFHGDLFMGFSLPVTLGGPLFHFDLSASRRGIEVSEPELRDRVADNNTTHDLTESETFLIGTHFGVVTDIKTAPDGNLFVVSLSNGQIYEIFQREEPEPTRFTADLTGEAEVPGPGDPEGQGSAIVTIDQAASEICYAIIVSGISLPATGAHIHVGTADVAGDIVVPLEAPGLNGASGGCVTGVDPALIEAILADPAGYYVNVHTEDFPAGAIRGQLTP